jgi:SAM-dependent methyltransferase
MSNERDYMLGTHDEEVARLGVQHRVWRDRVLDGWQRAGIGPGQTVVDLGSGPGFATMDLADVVNHTGRVLAIERSRRFLDVLEAERDRRRLTHISIHEADLDEIDELPVSDADALWCRWVLAFVRRPQPLVTKCVSSLRPGGVAVFHEYLNYATWRLIPPVKSFDDFVPVIRETWREEGGEPDIAAVLPHWLEQAGMDIVSLRPYVDVVSPGDALWEWPQTFVHSSLDRLVALGRLEAGRAQTIRQDFMAHAASPGARLVTPIVLEIIARKR